MHVPGWKARWEGEKVGVGELWPIGGGFAAGAHRKRARCANGRGALATAQLPCNCRPPLREWHRGGAQAGLCGERLGDGALPGVDQQLPELGDARVARVGAGALQGVGVGWGGVRGASLRTAGGAGAARAGRRQAHAASTVPAPAGGGDTLCTLSFTTSVSRRALPAQMRMPCLAGMAAAHTVPPCHAMPGLHVWV